MVQGRSETEWQTLRTGGERAGLADNRSTHNQPGEKGGLWSVRLQGRKCPRHRRKHHSSGGERSVFEVQIYVLLIDYS